MAHAGRRATHATPTIRQFYRAHNCRNADVIEARMAAIADARPLTTDAAVVEPLSLSVHTYATRLRALTARVDCLI